MPTRHSLEFFPTCLRFFGIFKKPFVRYLPSFSRFYHQCMKCQSSAEYDFAETSAHDFGNCVASQNCRVCFIRYTAISRPRRDIVLVTSITFNSCKKRDTESDHNSNWINWPFCPPYASATLERSDGVRAAAPRPSQRIGRQDERVDPSPVLSLFLSGGVMKGPDPRGIGSEPTLVRIIQIPAAPVALLTC